MIFIEKNRIPFVSVIVCTYNRSHLLTRALDSLISQTLADWECLIVDDGSTDNTYKVAHSYLENDTRFRYMYHTNRGVSYSRNVGLLAASGMYISFLDSDDKYKEFHLESRMDMLLANDNVDFLHGGVKIIGNEYVPDMHNPNELIHLSQCKIGGTFFVKKNKAIEIGGFDNIYGDDAAFYEKAQKHGLSIAYTDVQSYIYYRDQNDSITNSIEKKQ